MGVGGGAGGRFSEVGRRWGEVRGWVLGEEGEDEEE